MSENLIAWLKVQGLNPAVDFGNLSVGIATACIAVVSLFVALQSGRSNSNIKIAEFRQNWIDRLRLLVAEFGGLCNQIANTALSHHSGQKSNVELDRQNSEIKRIEANIRLMLNPSEVDHSRLIELTQQMRGRAAVFSLTPNQARALELGELEVLMTDLTSLILKVEWQRVNNDTYGKGRIARFFSMRRLDKKIAPLRADTYKRLTQYIPAK